MTSPPAELAGVVVPFGWTHGPGRPQHHGRQLPVNLAASRRNLGGGRAARLPARAKGRSKGVIPRGFTIGYRALTAALPLNTHLRKLDLRRADLSSSFVPERLLPALRANTSLREFTAADSRSASSAPDFEEAQRRLRAAEEFVEAREAARVDAERAAGGTLACCR